MRSQRERFWEKVEKTPGCWIWTAFTSTDGYGRFKTSGNRVVQAHRWAWEQENGPIPDHLVPDHLCRNRSCVNPAHLQLTTRAENTLRGEGPTAINARKTHCKRGHALDEANTYVWKSGRICRACHSMHAVASRRRKAA